MASRGVEDGVFFVARGEDVKAAAAAALEHHMDIGAVGEFRKQNGWTSRLEKVGQFLDLTG